jgi:hypothetical protein
LCTSLPVGGPQGHISKLQTSQVQFSLHIFLTWACMLHSPSCASETTICSLSILHGSFPRVQACLKPKLPSMWVAKALLPHCNESHTSQARFGSGNPLALSLFLPQHTHCALWIIPEESVSYPIPPPTYSMKEGDPLLPFAPLAC